jgi:hypothetical protein
VADTVIMQNSADTANYSNKYKYFNKKMKEMFKARRISLREELGSVKKDFLYSYK